MNPQDENPSGDVTDIEAARLALRGALSTIRDLQDMNVRLKGNLQEAANKEKLSQQGIEELRQQVARWEESSKQWEDARRDETEREQRMRERVRLQVREEERARIVAERQENEETLARLTSSVEELRKGQQRKEEELRELKRLLEAREVDLMSLQREKLELSNRFHQDAEMVGKMRQRRDEEISATLRRLDSEVESKEREIDELRRKNSEFAKVLAAQAQEVEIRLQDREEGLIRDYKAKESALEEKYLKRDAELQARWAELENGMWERAKEARAKLDSTAHRQFEERAKALADRSREIEDILEKRRVELAQEFQARLTGMENAFAEKERRLASEYSRKESDLLARFEAELAKEKETVAHMARERERAQEAEFRERMARVERGEAELKEQLDRERKKLEVEFSEKESAARMAANAKEAALHEEFQRKQVELQESHLRMENELREEWTHRKKRLLEDQEKAVEAERAILQSQAEAESRKVDEAYRARVAELDAAHKTTEEQFRSWRAGIVEDYLQKEKNLDRQWMARERELASKYELALDHERRNAAAELAKSRDGYEQMRKQDEADVFSRTEAIRHNYVRLERELRGSWEKRADELNARQEQAMSEERDRFRAAAEKEAERLRLEMFHRDAEWKEELSRLREKLQAELTAAERRSLEKESEAMALNEKCATLNEDKERLRQELWRRDRKFEEERAQFEKMVGDSQALELARLEEVHQQSLQEWKRTALAEMDTEKKAWMERQRRALVHEKQILEEQAKRKLDALETEFARKLEEPPQA